jgi:hypothetical protein
MHTGPAEGRVRRSVEMTDKFSECNSLMVVNRSPQGNVAHLLGAEM